MHYRPEIDGLRAVAVLPVMLFHAGFDLFAGGYVGVDVFFVISGYLITSIINTDLEKGRFSIRKFYERRARRILPALFLVMLCCLPFAWMWMLPRQFKDFSHGLIAVSLFASNILFWRQTGYFMPAAELNPLLHTWSLAVEEQFYILFPLLLLLTWRFGRSPVFYMIVGLSLCSLLLAEWGWRNAPTANFYLIPTRAWELGVGSMCAFLMHGKPQRDSSTLSGAGLALILFSIFYYDGGTPFPSLYALAPVGGTALIILFSGPSTWITRLLSTRVLVGIGLISYSAYLWHQPLFAFARIRSLTEPAPELMAALAVAALGLAYLSWTFVELPFRKKPRPALTSQTAVFAVSGGATSALIAIGLYGHISDGAGFRVSLPDTIVADISVRLMEEECFDPDTASAPKHGSWACRKGQPGGATRVAVIGDSHAFSFLGPMSEHFEKHDIEMYFSAIAGCPPLLNANVHTNWRIGVDCNNRNAQFFDEIIAAGVDAVILISRWTFYSTGDIVGNFEYIGAEPNPPADREASLRFFRESLDRTVEKLTANSIPVILLHQAPIQTIDARHLYGWFSIFGYFDEVIPRISLPYDRHRSNYAEMQRFLDSYGGMDLAYVVDFADALCHSGVCNIGDWERSVYWDYDHLSNFGAQLVLPRITTVLEQALTESLRSASDHTPPGTTKR